MQICVVYLPTPCIWPTQIPRFTDPARPPTQSSVEDDVPLQGLLSELGLPARPAVYKRTANTLPWLSAHLPSTHKTQTRPPCAPPCHAPQITSIISSTPLHACHLSPCDPIRSPLPLWGPFVFPNRGIVAPRIAVNDASCLRFISDVLPLFPSPRVMPHWDLDTLGLPLVYIHHHTAVELAIAHCATAPVSLASTFACASSRPCAFDTRGHHGLARPITAHTRVIQPAEPKCPSYHNSVHMNAPLRSPNPLRSLAHTNESNVHYL